MDVMLPLTNSRSGLRLGTSRSGLRLGTLRQMT